MEQSSYDLIKQSIGLRLDNIIQLGCKLLMYDNAYRKKPPPTDEEVRRKILSVINKSTNKKRKSKIKPYAEWTEQERIAEFTRNRELIRSGEIGGTQDVSYVPSDYDISKPKCLRNLAEFCFFIAILYAGYYYGDGDDIESLKVSDFFDITISKKSHEAIGYWTPKLKKGMSYVYSQGKNSLEVGQCTMNIAKDVLKKYGGIKGYKELRPGEKKNVRDEIEEATQFKDERQVYNILKKLRNNKQN
jgi:hypothetical protein